MLIYDVLKKDHMALKALLSQLILLDESQEEQRHSLIEQIRDELVPHARAEEAIFYNALRSLDAGKNNVTHGYKEHLEAETFLRLLQVQEKIDFQWKETAKKLKETVEHHIQEEEERIFGIAQQCFSNEEATAMATAFETLKKDVKAESFVKTTWELVMNMMPPRIASALQHNNFQGK